MANPEHLEKLRERVDAWNLWREKHPEIVPDLEQASFEGTDLQGINLRGANLRRSTVTRANLKLASLRGANLSSVWLAFANSSKS